MTYADDYADFNNEAAELLEKQSPFKPEIVSYSEVFKWDTCQRQYYYTFDRNLSPLEHSPAMTTGIKGHRLLQSFYEFLQQGKTKEEALELTHVRAKNLMETEKFADFELAHAWTLVDNYIRDTDFTYEIALVENRFLIPFNELNRDSDFDDVMVGFTPDVVFKRKGGFHDVEDSKFIQKAWSQPKINRFPQAKLYQIFLQLMGYKVSRSTIRFFNVKTGKITAKNYELLEEEKNILLNDFVKGVKEVVRHRRQSQSLKATTRRTMNYTACQYCAFETPCSLEAEGKSAEKTFKYFYKDNDYSYGN